MIMNSTVLALFFFTYYVLVFSFAGILVAMESRTGGRCGLNTYESWTESDSYYELAFELSWTTFTSVGYGIVSPSGDDDDCYPIRFVCSLFAFMGLLFNSLSAAIFFSKLERVLTHASVTFCSGVCVQFGNAALYTRGSKGVHGQFWLKSQASCRSLVSVESEGSKIERSARKSSHGQNALHDETKRKRKGEVPPYPVLEFRIVNDSANHKNRAIRNARVTAMVQLSSEDADAADMAASRSTKQMSSSETFREYITVASVKDSFTAESKRPTFPPKNDSNDCTPIDRRVQPRIARNMNRGKHGLTESIVATALVVQETDADSERGSGPEGRVYYPLNLEPHSIPYFQRVLYARHTLNSRSPLLKQHVREKIKKDGCWDPKACQYQDILESLVDFYRIRITFKGTSSVNSTAVFAQKVYTIEDVYLGYQFSDIFFKKERNWFRRLWRPSAKKQEEEDDNDDSLVLDKRLIHDILPQLGGGQEPLTMP